MGNSLHLAPTRNFRKLKGEDLRSTVDFVGGLEVESATDFQKVFHVILKVDEVEKLREEHMI